jgi:hypothetical protein
MVVYTGNRQDIDSICLVSTDGCFKVCNNKKCSYFLCRFFNTLYIMNMLEGKDSIMFLEAIECAGWSAMFSLQS